MARLQQRVCQTASERTPAYRRASLNAILASGDVNPPVGCAIATALSGGDSEIDGFLQNIL